MHIFNSMESDVLFPTIDAYDMHTAGGLALYSTHCDFYPFKSVIENKKSTRCGRCRIPKNRRYSKRLWRFQNRKLGYDKRDTSGKQSRCFYPVFAALDNDCTS